MFLFFNLLLFSVFCFGGFNSVFRGMQAYFALIDDFRHRNAEIFIMLFFLNIFCSKCSFFSYVGHRFFICKMWNKMFWRDKKKFHNPVILFLRFVFLFWAVPFSFFFWNFSFFFLSNFFFRGGCFFGLFLLLLFGVGERWFFLSYISRFFKIFRFFCTFFWFCIDIFFVKPLLKNKSGKKKQNFCKYLFSSNYDLVLISFFCF